MTTDILAVIARLAWRQARPQAWGEHEYTVRVRDDPQREADFVALFNAIEADGVVERWRGRRKRYLHPGDGFKYWAMSSLRASIVLNRMLVADDIERLRREGV